jgi:hypothetical protein
MKPDDKDRFDLCISEGEAIGSLSWKDLVGRYDHWQQKALDAVGLAFGYGSQRYTKFNFNTIHRSGESLEQRCADRLNEQLKLLRRYALTRRKTGTKNT